MDFGARGNAGQRWPIFPPCEGTYRKKFLVESENHRKNKKIQYQRFDDDDDDDDEEEEAEEEAEEEEEEEEEDYMMIYIDGRCSRP